METVWDDSPRVFVYYRIGVAYFWICLAEELGERSAPTCYLVLNHRGEIALSRTKDFSALFHKVI